MSNLNNHNTSSSHACIHVRPLKASNAPRTIKHSQHPPSRDNSPCPSPIQHKFTCPICGKPSRYLVQEKRPVSPHPDEASPTHCCCCTPNHPCHSDTSNDKIDKRASQPHVKSTRSLPVLHPRLSEIILRETTSIDEIADAQFMKMVSQCKHCSAQPVAATANSRDTHKTNQITKTDKWHIPVYIFFLNCAIVAFAQDDYSLLKNPFLCCVDRYSTLDEQCHQNYYFVQ